MTSNESNFHVGQPTPGVRTGTAARLRPLAMIAAALAALAMAAGCATDPSEGDTGELVLPLLQSVPGGDIFRLDNAIFDILENRTGIVTTVDGSGNQTSVNVTLPPGLGTVSLRPGWFLLRSQDGGATYQPVSALLGSPSAVAFRVLANQVAIIQFTFLIREVTGTLVVRLGVVTQPRELAGGVVVEEATGILAPYAEPANRSLDFAVFFELRSLDSVVLPDGTKQLVYTVNPFDTAGPNQPSGSALATEFYNDNLGILSGQVATDLTASFMEYTVAAKPDGTLELAGSVQGFATLSFGPSPIDAILPGLDANGFPNDAFFYDSGSPFTLTTLDGSTMSGILRVRQLVP